MCHLHLPQLLLNVVMGQNAISYPAFATQMTFFLMFIVSDLFILSVMAYDHCMVIYNLLLYNVIIVRDTAMCWWEFHTSRVPLRLLIITSNSFTISFCISLFSHLYCGNISLSCMLYPNRQDITLMIHIFVYINVTSFL